MPAKPKGPTTGPRGTTGGGQTPGKQYPNGGTNNPDGQDPNGQPNDPGSGGDGLCTGPQEQEANRPDYQYADRIQQQYRAAPHLGQGGTYANDPRAQLGRLSGWNPLTHQREVRAGIVESVGATNNEDRGLYTIHHPFHTSFAGLSFRPQLWKLGYPNVERNPQLTETILRADERRRPSVLVAHAWGAQSDASPDFAHVQLPMDSRARGGTGHGGLVLHPPRFEMEDYFGINSQANVEDTTSALATRSYLLAAPGVSFALGKPKADGGLQPGGVTIGRDYTLPTKPMVVNYDSVELMRGFQSGSEVIVELAQGGSTAIKLPYGTNAQRPATPARGHVRINTSGAADVLEWWNPGTSAWVSGGGGGGGISGIDWYDNGVLVNNRPAVDISTNGALSMSMSDNPGLNRVDIILKVDQAALTSIAPLTPAADKLAYYTSGTAAATTDLTAFARTLLDDPDAATMLATLGLSGLGGAQGTATIDFGSFPGASDASVTITGQTGIDSLSSNVQVWMRAEDSTDHTAEEHMVETIALFATDIVNGVGFTIRAFNTSQVNEPLTSAGASNFRSAATTVYGTGENSIGGKGTLIWGKWNINWRWS